MEEEKAAAYYDELTRKGEGAARFKQGLGFSANKDSTVPPQIGSLLPSSTASSFLNTFVKASSPTQVSKFEKQAQLESIQKKLKKKPKDQASPPRFSISERSSRESCHHRNRLRSRSRDRGRNSRRRSRSRSTERNYRRRSRSRERYRERRRDRRSERTSGNWSRSLSPEERRSEKRRSDAVERERVEKDKNVSIDYSRLIEGYEKLTPAERVKARMKFQLNEAAEKDEGMSSGWERFEFNSDAPLDDEEIEAAEDDAALVENIGQSFRFSAVQARRKEQIKAAHDEAMFGAPSLSVSGTPDIVVEVYNTKSESKDSDLASRLLSDKVLAKQQGSWRDRARKL